jgi:hypothetical protein
MSCTKFKMEKSKHIKRVRTQRRRIVIKECKHFQEAEGIFVGRTFACETSVMSWRSFGTVRLSS